MSARIVALCVDIPSICFKASSTRNDTTVLTVRLFTVSDTELQKLILALLSQLSVYTCQFLHMAAYIITLFCCIRSLYIEFCKQYNEMTSPSMCQAYLPATQRLSISRNPCIYNFIFLSSLITFIKRLTIFFPV